MQANTPADTATVARSTATHEVWLPWATSPPAHNAPAWRSLKPRLRWCPMYPPRQAMSAPNENTLLFSSPSKSNHRPRCPRLGWGGLGVRCAQPRSAGVGPAGASPLQHLTGCGCLSAAPAGREASSAARPHGEHHREPRPRRGKHPPHNPPHPNLGQPANQAAHRHKPPLAAQSHRRLIWPPPPRRDGPAPAR